MNLVNDKALNSYIEYLACRGEKVDTFTIAELKDAGYIKVNKDKVIRAMTYQWIKANVRDYLTERDDAPYLQKVNKIEKGSPDWLKVALKEGKEVYFFDKSKIPSEFYDDLQKIKDYLYSAAEDYLSKVLERKKPRVSIDALKQRPEHKNFALALDEANKWHERIAREAEGRKLDAEERRALKAGTKTIMDLGDGFTAVRLLTPEALDKESDYMGHCVGKGGYDEGVKNETIQIYSIRDKNGEPHATFEVIDKKIVQCKGKSNEPVVSKYLLYLSKFVIEQNLNPGRDTRNIGLCRDTDGNLHSIYNIPAGTVFDYLNLSGLDFTELPEVLSTCTVKSLYLNNCTSLKSLKNCPKGVKRLEISGCTSLTSLKGCPDSVESIYCPFCTSLETLEGCSKNAKEISCYGCDKLKYIPYYIFGRMTKNTIKGLPKSKIAECKAGWLKKNNIKATKTNLIKIISAITHLR